MARIPINRWWYYGLEHGQHVSFLSDASLRIIAQKYNLKIHYSNDFIHLMGKEAIHPALIKIAFSKRFDILRRIISKHSPSSLLQSDFEMLTEVPLK